MFNVIHYQSIVNENYLEILSPAGQDGYHQEEKKKQTSKRKQMLVKIWGKENVYLLLVGIQTMILVERPL